MLKQNARILTVTKVLFDAVLICAAFFISWSLKFAFNSLATEGHLPLSKYLELLYVGIPCFLAFQSIFGLYKPQRLISSTKEVSFLLINSAITFVAILVYLFVFKIYDVSRVFTALFCFFSFILTTFGRAILRKLLRFLRKKGYNQKYVLMLGFSKQGQAYLDAISRHKEMGYNIIGILDETERQIKNVPYLGTLPKLEKILEAKIIDEVVISLPLELYYLLPNVLKTCERSGVKSVIIPAYTDYIPAKPQMDEIDSIPLINTRYIPLDNLLFSSLKYGFDFIISLFLIIVLSPILLAVSVLIKLTSKGPVLYTQERIGYNKKPFKIYKFRTMTKDAPDGWTVEDDPRVTPIGKFLRSYSIDELPQLFNVLKGEMSLVGPRPEQTLFVEKFKEIIPKYMLKHRVRPGITGLAQVNGLRGDTSIEERIRYDIDYIENWNPFLDIKIILMTPFAKRGY